MASIRRVVPLSPPNAVSTVPEGTVLALKIARPDDQLAEEALGREVETFVALSRAPGSPPCPRLYDIIGNPPTGLVMEWCPTDMERWWEQRWAEPRSFIELCEALADVCRRVREYEAVAELELGKRVIHADIKPRNVLRAADGRWLLTDFGASKSRSVDEHQWVATRMILGTENFIAPEALFNARKPHPAAMDTWSLGCTLFALLRMRTLLRGGGRMPPNGTHAHPFRSHRVGLVSDLQQRKPGLFVDKDIDPSAFTSPEKLPEKDRKAVAEALVGVFGNPNGTLEGVLAGEVLNLLDRALRIDPARRFRDPLEMAGELEALAQRFRELAFRAEAGTGPGPRVALPSDPVTAPASEARQETNPQAGASAPRVLVAEEIVVDDGNVKKASAVTAVSAARVPPWIGLALLVVIGLQATQVLVSIATLVILLQTPDPVVALPAPAPGPLATATAAAPTIAPPPAAAVETMAAAVPVETVAPVAEPPPAAPEPAPEAKVVPPPKRIGTPPPAGPAGTGVVLVSGGQAYLLGPDGKKPTGSISIGTYELFVQTRSGGEFESQGLVSVVAGDRIVYKCGLGTCKRN